jgi:uncharacterized protein
MCLHPPRKRYLRVWLLWLAVSMLQGAMLGSLIGTPLGIFLVAPWVPDLWIKIVFAVIWASFGILHMYRMDEISGHEGMTEFDEHWDRGVGFALGLFSGCTVVAVTGVGIDMVLYATLVLLCRADLKIAIPTSVIIMAFTSVYGIAIKNLFGTVQPGVFDQWIVAACLFVFERLRARGGVLVGEQQARNRARD